MGGPTRIDVNDVILNSVGYGRSSTLDLIASRLELSRTLKNPTGKERRLARGIGQVDDRYDLVVIDCAPTESILTDAAYFASRFVVVPVKPEFMATIGLPLLERSIRAFRLENEDHELEIAGLVINDQSEYADNAEKAASIAEVRNVGGSARLADLRLPDTVFAIICKSGPKRTAARPHAQRALVPDSGFSEPQGRHTFSSGRKVRGEGWR